MTSQSRRSTDGTTVGVGVIGLGFMGRTHIGAYREAKQAGLDCDLVAVCDARPGSLDGSPAGGGNLDNNTEEERLFDPEQLLATPDVDELLACPDVSLVSVCTPTPTHVELAIRALKAGKHVLVEKPVAVRAEDARRLADAAKACPDLICMPAMCMRFWPGWDWLKSAIDENTFGTVRSASFTRLGSAPDWSGFYGDDALSGGALVDLHVHDADFVLHCFGEPAEVVARGSRRHVAATYRFDDGPEVVTAEGGWDASPSFGFRMRYTVHFERATADFDLGRDTPLMLHDENGSSPIKLADSDGYRGEIEAIVREISGGGLRSPVPIEDSVRVAELLETEASQLHA